MRATSATRRWALAATLITLGGLVVAGCDGLSQTSLTPTNQATTTGLKLKITGDFSRLRSEASSPRFGRLVITPSGKAADKLQPLVLTRSDLAAVLAGNKTIAGLTLTDTELDYGYLDLAPGDLSVSVTLFDMAEGGDKLSDTPVTKTLGAGVIEVVRLDLSAALTASGQAPAPAPTPTPTAAPDQGSLHPTITLVPNGDGQVHPVTFTGTLAETFHYPTASGSTWVYALQQLLPGQDASGSYTYTDTSTVSIAVGDNFDITQTTGVPGGAPYAVSDPAYGASAPYFDRVPGVRYFGTLNGNKLQQLADGKTYMINGQAHVGQHYVLSCERYDNEDQRTELNGVRVSTHMLDLYYENGVGLLESQDTLYMTDGSVKAGQSVRLQSFQAGH